MICPVCGHEWSHAGVGRPKSRRRATTPITREIRQLVDKVSGGNIVAAAKGFGIAYSTLRGLYNGTSISPNKNSKAILSAAFMEHCGVVPEIFIVQRPLTEVVRPIALSLGKRLQRTVTVPLKPQRRGH